MIKSKRQEELYTKLLDKGILIYEKYPRGIKNLMRNLKNNGYDIEWFTTKSLLSKNVKTKIPSFLLIFTSKTRFKALTYIYKTYPDIKLIPKHTIMFDKPILKGDGFASTVGLIKDELDC